ncbi:hypothetical protein BGZ65_009713 [Modicella reniformis]|uniref:Golgi apparatus membrane protein TVP38 n=1 Tax=Modicella reniformis TaxID=1440133 RepID=A0A9P6IVX7_9FUNG|nr:hypothetical protein BGZ65_009713 [Modicella reniformis]
MFGIAIFAGFHTRIFQLLETLAAYIKNLGPAGPPIIMIGLFLTAFPPMVGYSSLVTMSGYVYGFWFGLFIAYTSALLGSITCFYLCRRWFKVQVRALMAKKPSMKSVVKAVENRGFKLMLLIRLAPYPFNIINALLSATHIPLSTFALATAISLTKLALHVYIGSTLSSLAVLPPPIEDPEGHPGTALPADPTDSNGHGRSLKIVAMVISMTLGIAVGAYVWMVAKREIEASEGIRIERRRKKRQSLRQSRASKKMSSGGSGQGEAHGRGSGRSLNATATAHNQLLARSGPSGGLDLSGQERVPVIDLAGGGGGGGTSEFVGGAGMHEYLDDDEGHEDQALVSTDSFHGHGGSHHRRSGSATHLGYGTDSEESDFLDDDEDMSDMERGVEDGDSFSRSSTEMRDLSYPMQSPRRVERETMGWFAENGVDVSDRRW